MIIAYRSPISFFRLSLFFAFFLFGASVWVLVSFGLVDSTPFDLPKTSKNEAIEHPICADQFLGGAFLLKGSVKSPLQVALEKGILFLAKADRPDLQERFVRMGILGSEKEWVFEETSPLYLKVDRNEAGVIEGLDFSKSASGIELEIELIDAASLLLKAKGIEEFEFSIDQEHRRQKEVIPLCEELGRAKFFGNDCFFLAYGGEQYRALGQKHKVQIGSSAPLFLDDGQYLTSTAKKLWVKIDQIDQTEEGALLAMVFAKANGLGIKVWDGEGFCVFETLIPKEVPEEGFKVRGQGPLALEQVICDAKLRSDNQVSCRIGKKRLILRPGDWLLRSQGVLRKLTSETQIDDYLNHRIKGELVVIDQIDRNGRLCGQVFDPMRMVAAPFSIPIASSKRTVNPIKRRGR